MKPALKTVLYVVGLAIVMVGLFVWRLLSHRATYSGLAANLDPPIRPDVRGSDEAEQAYIDARLEYDRHLEQQTSKVLKMQSDEVIADFKKRFGRKE